METSVCPVARSGFTRVATSATSCGRTARKTSEHWLATSSTFGVVVTPYFSASSFARSGHFSAIKTEDLSSRADKMPSAIFPAPKNPILSFMLSSC